MFWRFSQILALDADIAPFSKRSCLTFLRAPEFCGLENLRTTSQPSMFTFSSWNDTIWLIRLPRLKRQNPHCSAVRIEQFTFSKDGNRRQPAKLLHRILRASLHTYGGALYSVTCSQRKYHYPQIYVVAPTSLLPVAASCFSLGAPEASPVNCHRAPVVWLNINGTYLHALFSFDAALYQPAWGHWLI